MFWGFFRAKAYEIQISNDNISWSTIFNTNKGKGKIDIISNLNTKGRYVRMQATKSSLFGIYSLNEMEVYSSEMNCKQGND